MPIPQEGHITTSPMVLGAVMFGRGREQAGVLIEPTREYAIPPGDDKALAEFRNRIWYVFVFAFMSNTRLMDYAGQSWSRRTSHSPHSRECSRR